MKLTEQQLERAARALCKERGVDPDALSGHSPPPNAHGIVAAVLLHSPNWRFAAREIERFLELARAIDEGLRDGNTTEQQAPADQEDQRIHPGEADQAAA